MNLSLNICNSNDQTLIFNAITCPSGDVEKLRLGTWFLLTPLGPGES